MKNIAIRHDRNAIVLFDKRDGTKVRFAIGKYTKATWPELCDISLTDWCPVGCNFCYRDSTISGKHATPDNIKLIVERLSKVKVQEVACGGGEATGHPNFVETMHLFRNSGIVPNFTSKLPIAIRKLWPEIKDVIGGFAYSAENGRQIDAASKHFKDIPNEKVNLHYVMGLGDKAHFTRYLMAARRHDYRVTLLGYKTTGRGKDVQPLDYSWWINVVNKLVETNLCPDLSIDTPLAAEYENKLPVAKHMFHTREGAFSMFIDAVSMKMGASSFDANEELVPFDDEWVKRYSLL